MRDANLELELVSRFGVTPSLREPARDLEAQLAALRDPDHPKIAMFVARGNEAEMPVVPRGVYRAKRWEGTLLTTEVQLAQLFEMADRITDADMARLLGYPETKADVLRTGSGVIVQARDAQGRVITEACASLARFNETVEALRGHAPEGGCVVVLSPIEALGRRVKDLH